MQDRKEAALASVMSGVVLFVMMLLIWTVLEIYYGKINLGEIPMLTMALRQNKVFGAIYGTMLFFAVITTDVSNGFNVLDIASRKNREECCCILYDCNCGCYERCGFF